MSPFLELLFDENGHDGGMKVELRGADQESPSAAAAPDNGSATRSSRNRLPRAGLSLDGPNVEVVRAYVDAIVAVTRSRAATDALEAALLADLVELSGASGRSSESDLGLRSLAAEVGAAVRVSDRTVQRRMSDAYQLVHEFPAVHAALSSGDISSRHVREILEHGVTIEPGLRVRSMWGVRCRSRGCSLRIG